uniref:Uncharacterized protein n=1 Tax=Acrobeloides nanus TaxID=290746 RepID=A0A914E8F6_9BILA
MFIGTKVAKVIVAKVSVARFVAKVIVLEIPPTVPRKAHVHSMPHRLESHLNPMLGLDLNDLPIDRDGCESSEFRPRYNEMVSHLLEIVDLEYLP